MKKHLLTFVIIAASSLLARPALACPNGYEQCGERGQLCCPRNRLVHLTYSAEVCLADNLWIQAI